MAVQDIISIVCVSPVFIMAVQYIVSAKVIKKFDSKSIMSRKCFINFFVSLGETTVLW